MPNQHLPAAPKGALLNEGLCQQLVKEFYRRTRAGEHARSVLCSLIHEVYAQGHAAGRRSGL